MLPIAATKAAPSLVGISMSELRLGESDADARWIGIRRHQAVLIIVGLGLTSAWVMSSHAPVLEVIAGLALMACAVPSFDGRTLGEHVVLASGFLVRSHWSDVNVREFGDDVVLWAHGEVAFRGYELVHRGRLDLSGRDIALAEALGSLADAASAARAGQHFSQHVVRHDGDVATLLTLPVDVPAPDGWAHNNTLALETLGTASKAHSLQIFERLTYLRMRDELVRIYRVRDFSAVSPTRGLLEQILRSPAPLDLAVHVDVVAGAKAHRLAARAVHRVGSDDATSRSAGFRRTARSARNFERLAQREALVAGGRSLLRVAVFVIVRGESLDEMHERSALVWRQAHDAGLRLERGWGLQSRWYVAQLPGGPGW
jgi:hypothetical protein